MTNQHSEAPFSANFRMTKHGESFQFTVRESDPLTFMQELDNLVQNLMRAGWQFMAQAPALSRPVVPPTGQAPQPQQQQQQPPQQQPPQQQLRTEDIIEGYVVGNYTSKRSNTLEPCVYLYTARRPFKAYTVYPEQFASLLPFHVSMDTAGTWSGSPPSKEDARRRGVYVSSQFRLPIVPLTTPDGQPVMKNGYMEYRPARVNELPPPPESAAPPPANDVKFMDTTGSVVAPFAGFPTIAASSDEYDPSAIHWSMQDDDDAASVMGLTEEELAFFSGFRSEIVGRLPVGGKITDAQWNLLSTWCAEQLGVEQSATVDVASVGHVPIAGLLSGIICDRYAERPAEFPGNVAVRVLRLIMPKRGSEVNHEYDLPTAGALSAILRKEYSRLSNGGGLASNIEF